ncbi:OLC1v1023680C1 [Oldenlandia corymbosa var. corymbosa]|uniref:Xyloglucan endotransglucosylase/hydrolase n=1 Tax=Oldenlandia corymbosa var. corymbosa TaxID=529605 RepID=A0AAV1C3C6_OLDCO|nr:OLC1v1023680C1 [Oldenlandia corymbosa var. corymbosa]
MHIENKMRRSIWIFSILVFVTLDLVGVSGSNISQEVSITYGTDKRAKFLDGGLTLSLSLDNFSGSGFQSNNEYLFGRFDIRMKLVPGNSAGTVATFYLSSQGPAHDEVDFEFLGNASGQPYTLSTNVYSQGKGNREQQFRLWFDPTIAYHTYTIVWNPQNIIFLVDNIPIRIFVNKEARGVPFPNNQPMKIYGTLWDAEDWATQGGRVKTDWSNQPFTIYYQNFDPVGCVVPAQPGSPPCNPTWQPHDLDPKGRNLIRWAQQKSMIYNYCVDRVRFPRHRPRECRGTRF